MGSNLYIVRILRLTIYNLIILTLIKTMQDLWTASVSFLTYLIAVQFLNSHGIRKISLPGTSTFLKYSLSSSYRKTTRLGKKKKKTRQ